MFVFHKTDMIPLGDTGFEQEVCMNHTMGEWDRKLK